MILEMRQNNVDTTSPTTNDTNDEQSSFSVLRKGVVEARGCEIYGSKDDLKRNEVHAEIQSFIDAPVAWKMELRSLLSVLMFVTRLPVPPGIDIHPGYVMKGMVYFPVIGCLVGTAVATVYDIIAQASFPPIVAACASTAFGLWLTGCFHEDGLCDTADGFGGGWTRDQILKIMTDSRVGTYGCATLGIYTITKVHLLAAMGTSSWCLNGSGSLGGGPALVVAHTLSRLTSPYLIRSRDYIDDEEGPKSSFYAYMIQAKFLVSRSRVIAAALLSYVIASSLFTVEKGLLLIAAVLVFAHEAGKYGETVLGGVMGDFLGATICLCELVVLSILLVLQQEESGTPITTMGTHLAGFLQDPKRNFASLIYENQRASAVLKAVLLWCIYRTWCFLVKSMDKVGDGKKGRSSKTD